ncbi:MAG: Nif3-like dinuclear metal center hexameric protein [Bacteroidia bacterium]|nr:Nif3-like dinuclear metal center hexameric protein [Bacteroidia bacterium]
MIVQDIINHLEELAPLAYAEDFDNVGLLVGDKNSKVKGILVTLDTLEQVVDEAIQNNCNLIVSFHPIIFSGLKKITGRNYVERVVLKAIRNNIAIYAIHTALDNSIDGVNKMICNKLKLKNCRVLIPKNQTIKKLTTYVPVGEADLLRNELFKVGAGHIGNYHNCSFNIEGIGTFKGNEKSNPVKGQKGKTHFEPEVQVSMTYEKNLEKKILNTLFRVHSYEEVAYEVITLENANQTIGMGMIGELDTETDELSFLTLVKSTFNCLSIKHSQLLKKPVKKVAVLGGSGSFAIENAIASKADMFVTSDLKYHDFYRSESKIVLADIGHYESEQFTKNLIVSHLTKKISNFAIILSKINTNPINYF